MDKPGGIPTVSEPGGIRPTVAEFLMAERPELADIGKPGEAGICHRLDNETSGCLLVAKTSKAYQALRAQFDAEAIEKEYLALLLGATPEELKIARSIAHHPRRRNRMLVCDTADQARRYKALPALTVVHRTQLFPATDHRAVPYALCTITIRTGVRHQIRAHCAYAGFSIAGDRLYQTAADRRIDTLLHRRHFLHASQLTFQSPGAGHRITVRAPIPEDLQEILDSMT